MRVLLCPSDGFWASYITVKNIMKHISSEFECDARILYNYQPKDEDYDIIYFHCNLSFGKRQIDLVRKHCPNTKLLTGVRGWIGYKNGKHLLKHYDGINTDNQKLLMEIKKTHPDAHLCHAGVDVNLFKPMKVEKHKTFTVGWAGLRGPTKNWGILDKLNHNTKITTRKRDSEGNIIVDTPHQEMPKWYNRLHVYLQLSTWGDIKPKNDAEGCPLPVLEAGACGLPVLATSTSGAAREYLSEWQIIHEYIGGLGFIELKEKLEMLKRDEALQRELGKRNQREAEKYWSWKVKVKQYERFFRDAVN